MRPMAEGRLPVHPGRAASVACRRRGIERPSRPSGPLTAEAIGAAVARHLPEQAVVVDEALTSALPCWQLTHGAPPHDHLAITGDLASFWSGPYAQVRAEMRGGLLQADGTARVRGPVRIGRWKSVR